MLGSSRHPSVEVAMNRYSMEIQMRRTVIQVIELCSSFNEPNALDRQ